MTNLVQDIQDFHEKFGLEYMGRPRILPYDVQKFREDFLFEEFEEYTKATKMLSNTSISEFTITTELENALDGLVDLVYVALGTAHLHGFNFEEAWRRVHEANMNKVRVQVASDSKRGSIYDVVKPDGWVPPCHRDLVEHHAHKD